MNPITRAELQMLSPQNHERLRIKQIQEMVETIYSNVQTTASDTTVLAPTIYRHLLKRSNEVHYRKYSDEFLEANMVEILERVRTLFPDCVVKYTQLLTVVDKNGIPTYSEVTPSTCNPVQRHNVWISSFIVVDWS